MDDIRRLQESPEYQALSPGQKSIIDKYDAMDLEEYKAQVSPDRYLFGNFVAQVYNKYAATQVLAHYSGDKTKLSAYIAQYVGDATFTRTMSGRQIASVLAFRRATALWSATIHGDPAVLPEKVATAKKLLFNQSIDAFQSEASAMDGGSIDVETTGFPDQSMGVATESAVFIAPRTGRATLIAASTVNDKYIQTVYDFIAIDGNTGSWVKQYVVAQGSSGYLTEAQLKDSAALAHNANI